MSNNKRLFDLISNYQKDFAKDIMVAGRSKDSWKTYSSNEFVEIVDYISKGLLAKGIQKGDRIALMSGNRPEWNFIDFACNQLGVATVPLYPTLSNQDLIYILNDDGAKLLFVSNEELAKKADLALKENNQELEVFTFDDIQDRKNYLEVLGLGKQNDQDLQPFRDAVQPDDLLTLIYTSGTTGKPKGVYLSHNNIISNVEACNHLVTDEYKKALSFLPLCHIFERMVVYLYLSKGVQIYYAENLDNIVVDINDVKPDLFTTVPRVLEKVYDKVVEKGKNLTGIKKSLFFWALNLGLRYQEPKKNSGFYNFQLGIARKLIFSKWKDALGGNIKLIISGG